MVPDGREVVSCGGGEMITRIYDVRKKSIFNKRKKKILKELIKDIINKKGVSNTKYYVYLWLWKIPKLGNLKWKQILSAISWWSVSLSWLSGPPSLGTHYNQDGPRIHKGQMKNPICKINSSGKDFILLKMILKGLLGERR